jgi:3-oxoacyl-[acyl-carrier protein] reductase
MVMLLKDQIALVTGGSRGIGRAIVKAFAKEGAKVAFVFRGNQTAADSLVQEVAEAGNKALAIQGDVGDPGTPTQVLETLTKEWGERLDILVNNAGVIRDTLFVRMTEEDWRTVMSTNLDAVFRFCRAAADRMVFKQRYGRIINISSIAADHVNKGQSNYAASKGAMNSLTRCLALEVSGRGVTVNAIAPGFIETDMSEAIRNKAGDLIKKMVPAKRLGQPDDIAGAAVFLASPAASYITGQVLTVDGGLSLGVPELG